MPPRGRKRNTRMDAALDAMGAMGFDGAIVRAVVKELLKIYTEEGWIFIEENSYRLLIDTILEKQEEVERQQIDVQGGENVAQSSAGPLSLSSLPSSANAHDVSEEVIDAPEVVRPMMNVPPSNSSSTNHEIDCLPETEVAKRQNSKEGGCKDDPSGIRVSSPAHHTRSHKPSYGWISENEDEDPECNLIELPRMSLDEFKRKYYFRMGFHQRQRKRKSRWDVGPDS